MHVDTFEQLERIINNNFKDALTWDQKTEGLRGKYFYVKYEEKEIGIFVGYITDESHEIRACTTFLFVHPLLCMSSQVTSIEKLFHKIMIRANIKLKRYPYRIVTSGLPALIRTMYLDKGYEMNIANSFFDESLAIMKQCEALYLK